MTITLKAKRERLTPDVPWYSYSEKWISILVKNKIKLDVKEENDLTRVTTLIFPDQATYDAWLANPDVVSERETAAKYAEFAKIKVEIQQV